LCLTIHLFATLCAKEDAVEGVQAFLGKRRPEWKERRRTIPF